MEYDQTLNDDSTSLLRQAFESFSRASSRLEEKYLMLLKETEVLREQLREKDREIKRSERLSMLGETAAAIAHEVRNPLGSIKLFVSLLKSDLADRPESLKMLDTIDQSINSLDHSVSNILHFARDQRPALAPLNINSLIAQHREHFRQQAECQAEISTDFQGNPFILGNEHDLSRALYNLILNALQATHYQGSIQIRTHDEWDGSLKVIIKDNGPGIPGEILSRIFDPFVTGRNEGTGLGLAIVRRIVEQHGGRISAANQEGAQFTIVFPRRQSAGAVKAHIQQEKD